MEAHMLRRYRIPESGLVPLCKRWGDDGSGVAGHDFGTVWDGQRAGRLPRRVTPVSQILRISPNVA